MPCSQPAGGDGTVPFPPPFKLNPNSRTSENGGPSKYRGVVWHKSNSKWEARIYENGKQRFLGYFTIEDAAALAYDEHAVRIHGNLAKLNFPERYAGIQLPSPQKPQHGKAAQGTSLPTNVYSFDHTPSADGAAPQQKRGGAPQEPGSRTPPFAQHPERPSSKGSSRFRGVSWNSNCNKWRAQVWKGSEVHHLGYFQREEDAARAYDEAVLRIRGPYTATNFPRTDYGYDADPQGPPPGQQPPVKREQSDSLLMTSNGVRAPTPTVAGASGFIQQVAPPGVLAPKALQPQAQKQVVAQEYHPPPPGTWGVNGSYSGMRGVSWNPTQRAWIAEVWNGQGYITVGAYPTEMDAAHAYDLAMLERQGEAAVTNFPHTYYETEIAAKALQDLATDPPGGDGNAAKVGNIAGGDRQGAQVPAAGPGSQFTGVSFDRRKGRWLSQIQNEGRRHFLGYFSTETDAAGAYDSAATRLHGSAAQLNFPAGAAGGMDAANLGTPAVAPVAASMGMHSDPATLPLPAALPAALEQTLLGAAATAGNGNGWVQAAPPPPPAQPPLDASSGPMRQLAGRLHEILMQQAQQQQQIQQSRSVAMTQQAIKNVVDALRAKAEPAPAVAPSNQITARLQAALEAQAQAMSHVPPAAPAANGAWGYYQPENSGYHQDAISLPPPTAPPPPAPAGLSSAGLSPAGAALLQQLQSAVNGGGGGSAFGPVKRGFGDFAGGAGSTADLGGYDKKPRTALGAVE